MKAKSLSRVIITALLLAVFATAEAVSFSNETLRYVISYKWGLVHKDAGEATLTLRNSGSNYSMMLAARTKPWADKLFLVRDTLMATVAKSGFRPLSYTKISHEGGKYGKDVIKYSYSGSKVTASCSRYKQKKGKTSSSSKTLSATAPAFDMLSIFYYLRQIDYAKLSTDRVAKTYIFSGSKVELLTIRYVGKETIKLRNKKQAQAYHIRFRFTSEGGKKSSDDMDTWISVQPPHIPYQLEGNLPVGKVKCYWIG